MAISAVQIAQVRSLFTQGYSQKSIAVQLGIARNTVIKIVNNNAQNEHPAVQKNEHSIAPKIEHTHAQKSERLVRKNIPVVAQKNEHAVVHFSLPRITLLLILISAAVASLGMELWGMHEQFGMSPYLLLVLIISLSKVYYSAVGRRGVVLLLATSTVFFACQWPLNDYLKARSGVDNCAMHEQAYDNAQYVINRADATLRTLTRTGNTRLVDSAMQAFNTAVASRMQAGVALQACQSAPQPSYYLAFLSLLIIAICEVVFVAALQDYFNPTKRKKNESAR